MEDKDALVIQVPSLDRNRKDLEREFIKTMRDLPKDKKIILDFNDRLALSSEIIGVIIVYTYKRPEGSVKYVNMAKYLYDQLAYMMKDHLQRFCDGPVTDGSELKSGGAFLNGYLDR
jgi:hypothetical protein